MIYSLLAEKSKKSEEWWKESMRSDLFLTAEELLDLGIIDKVI